MGKSIWILVVAFGLLSQANAQQATVSVTQMTAPDVPQGLIKLDVTATDAAGKPVTGLTQQDFTLLDDGQPEKILSFHAEDKTDPVEVILFIDVFNLKAAQVTQIRGEAVQFLRRDGGRLSHPVSIFQLSEEGFGRVGIPSADGNALATEVEKNHQVILQSGLRQSSLRGVPMPNSDTAEVTGLKAFGQLAIEERRKPGKKLILWVGPGFGDGTGAYDGTGGDHLNGEERRRLIYTVDWLSTLLRDARIVLDVFSVGGTEPVDLPLSRYTNYLGGPRSAKEVRWVHLYKKVVAIQTGGQAFEPSSHTVDEMESCVRGADAFYTISFDPVKAARPNEYHKVSVQIDKPTLTATNRTGYFDEPYYTDEADAETKPINLQQLEQTLHDLHGKRDGDVVQQLSEFHLTERLDGAKLAALISDLRGDKSRQQLAMLAGASAFLDPPHAEIPNDPAPDEAAQRQMISLALDAVNATIPKLPNVIATRTTVRYQEATRDVEAENTISVQPLHKADSSTVMVAYRKGGEVQEHGAAAPRKPRPDEASLVLNGTFGPALTAAVDILSSTGHLTWKRWGQGATGRRAVFSFSLPSANLSVATTGCCLPEGQGTNAFPAPSTYRGEIEIDPASGALLRLEVRGEPKSTTPMVRADTLIEYGPVDIGGKTYICPMRSVALTRERSVRLFSTWDESFRTYGPYTTLLNDISFSGYHVFRAQSRIIAAGGEPLP